MKTIAFFNNKGGVGKTSLVHHLAWMFSDTGKTVVVADFDPQANLTTMFWKDEVLENLWDDGKTVYTAIQPLQRGVGDIDPKIETQISDSRIFLLPGDLRLSSFEDELSQQWPKCMDANFERSFRVETAFARLIDHAAKKHGADYALVDVGPNLGAINRAALIACDYFVAPLAPDLFSLQGIVNLGPTIRQWREDWQDRKNKFNAKPIADLALPAGGIRPLGYLIMRYSIRLDRPTASYQKWIEQIPKKFRESVLEDESNWSGDPEKDEHRLATMKDYRSLMPLAQDARKPIFHLKPADGAIGAHITAAQRCGNDFKNLADKIVDAIERAERGIV